jgi:hypothetical protein
MASDLPDRTVYGLSEKDRSDIRELMRRVDMMQRNTQNRPNLIGGPDAQEILAPEVYLALTPPQGIPAVGEEIGTATATSNEEDNGVPIWYGWCEVWRVLPSVAGSVGTSTGPTAQEDRIFPAFTGIPVKVYNYSDSALPGGEWVLVARDKFGSWFAVSSGGAGGSGSSAMSFVQIINGPETGIQGDIWQAYILSMASGTPGFFTPSNADKCWVWNPMQQKLTPGKPYLGLANGRYTHDQAAGTGTGPGTPTTRPLYVIIGGWLTNVACVNSAIQQTRF